MYIFVSTFICPPAACRWKAEGWADKAGPFQFGGRRMSTAATNDVVVNATSTRCSWEKTHPQSGA